MQSVDPAKAIAVLKGVKGTFLVELGYDLRKLVDQNSPNGSECTLTSPRFEIQMADGNSFFIPCQLPTADESSSAFWRRLRWAAVDPAQPPVMACPMPVSKNATCNVPISCASPSGCGLDKRMQNVRIVQDVGPDSDGAAQFGLSVFDNIDVNGRLKGTGPGPRNGDEDEGQGRDNDGREFYHLDSPSHPEQGKIEFFVANLAGAHTRVLPLALRPYLADWTSDGAGIAYLSQGSAPGTDYFLGTALRIAKRDGSGDRELFSLPEGGLSDLVVVEKRLDRVDRDRKKTRNPDLDKEYELLVRCKAELEANTPLRNLEFDGEDEFFGLVDGFERELGYFSLSELQAFRGRFGLGIERDLYFEPRRLSALT